MQIVDNTPQRETLNKHQLEVGKIYRLLKNPYEKPSYFYVIKAYDIVGILNLETDECTRLSDKMEGKHFQEVKAHIQIRINDD